MIQNWEKFNESESKGLSGSGKGFFRKVGDSVNKFIKPDPIKIGELNSTEKKYTEQDLFDLNSKRS